MLRKRENRSKSHKINKYIWNIENNELSLWCN